MPRKVIAYACIYKCGRKITSKKRQMATHETWCWCNPEKHTCKTCRHDSVDPDESIYCDIDANDTGQLIRRDCPKWERAGGT